MNKKRALIIAGTASMISQFNMTNIEVLEKLHYKIDVAFDINHGNNIDEKEKERFKKELEERNIDIHQIDFSRSFLNLFGHIKAYKQINNLRKNNHYDIVHAHMPISSFLTRLAFRNERKNGTKVIYTAHGFHFFKGAPIINWILYYPLELLASYWTDTLILINKEDYTLAKKMHAKSVVYTPGIGVDVDRFFNAKANKKALLSQLNIPGNKFILLSIGELNDNKNQRLMIEALHELNNLDIYLLLVGVGENKEKLQKLINEYGLTNNIKLLGYRKDVDKICKLADCFIHTPKREGLGLASLEAMAVGLPVITTITSGTKDYTTNGITGYCIENDSVDELVSAINKMYLDKKFRNKCSKNNKEIVKKFSKEESRKVIEKVYKDANKI